MTNNTDNAQPLARAPGEYLVTWRIDMDADNATEAAARALAVMRDNDPANSATVFDVTDHEGRTVTVDLSTEDEA